MIKLNTIYSTKNGHYIVILRHPKAKWYEIHKSIWRSNLEDFDCLLKVHNPLFAEYKLSDIRYYARKIIDGEDF
jgi:hypothetical protein